MKLPPFLPLLLAILSLVATSLADKTNYIGAPISTPIPAELSNRFQPPAGHRWKTNHVMVAVIEAEPIPAAQHYYAILPSVPQPWYLGEYTDNNSFQLAHQQYIHEKVLAVIKSTEPLDLTKVTVEWHREFKPHRPQIEPPFPSSVTLNAGPWFRSNNIVLGNFGTNMNGL